MTTSELTAVSVVGKRTSRISGKKAVKDSKIADCRRKKKALERRRHGVARRERQKTCM